MVVDVYGREWLSSKPFVGHGGLSSVLFDIDVGDVCEADAHGGCVAGIVDAAEVDRAAAVAGAEFVDGGVEPTVFFLIGRWGGKRRHTASLNFVLYTMGGSIFMLISLLAISQYDLDRLRFFLGLFHGSNINIYSALYDIRGI